MPYENHWDKQSLYRRFTGVVNGEEILLSNLELHAEPNFQTITSIINDFTEVTAVQIEMAHTEVYAKTDDVIANSKGKLKIALVVDKPDLIALATNYRELMQGKLFECEIFNNIDEAQQWVE